VCIVSRFLSNGDKTDEIRWKGEMVAGSQIRGCTIEPVLDQRLDFNLLEFISQWIVSIDGIEADLGPFSKAIYQKLMNDAKQQRFQGFRPGTIPPMLLSTYKAFAMDECARETVLEVLQQNNIRPFDSTRMDMAIANISFVPVKQRIEKSMKRRKASVQRHPKIQNGSKDGTNQDETTLVTEESAPLATFHSMKDAIASGWQPGQSFTFVATNVKGQKVKDVEVP
jgi:hypothetical protein